MQNTLNIRSIVEQELQQKGYNLSRFSQVSGMNRGTLSLILNGNPSKLPSIPQLDKIAEALGYEQGWLYELYLEECFDREVPHWRRLKNFLYRCIQLDKEELIDKALHRLMEDCSQTAAVFDAAEEWYEEGHRQILLPFYRYVTVNEKYRHAERLAVSHYRIFRLSQSENFENNLRAAITFEPYRHELPVGFRLDGLLKLANIYYNQHIWEKVELYADELRELATEVYENKISLHEDQDREKGLETERHLVVYFGQGYVLKGNALANVKKYDEALTYISGYQNLYWFNGLDEIGQKEVLKLSHFSEANFLAVNLLKGNQSYLTRYTEFLRSNPNELLPGLMVIMDAANQHHFLVDHILDEFMIPIEKMKDELQYQNGYYQSTSSIERYEDLYRKLSVYFLKYQRYNEGIENLLKGLSISLRVNNKSNLLAYLAMGEVFRNYATNSQINRFEFIMREVLKLEEVQLSNFIPDNVK